MDMNVDIRDGDSIDEEVLHNLLESYLDYLEEDDGAAVNRCVRHSKDADYDSIRGSFSLNFFNWVSRQTDEDWLGILNDIGGSKVRDSIEELYNEEGEFKERVDNNILVMTTAGAELGWLSEQNEEEEDREQNNMYEELKEVGIVDEDMDINYKKLRGAVLAYAKDVDEILGTEMQLNRNDLKASFNRWMLGKFDKEWVKLTSQKLDPDDLMEAVLYMYKNNEDFKELVREKYEYAPEELEGNSEWRENLERKKKQKLDNYEDDDTETDEKGANEDGEEEPEDVPDGDSDISVSVNSIIHGDSVDVIDSIIDSDIRIDAIITDPPYGQDYEARGEKHEKIANDSNARSAVKLTAEVLKKTRMTLNKGSPIVIFAGKDNLVGAMDLLDEWFTFVDINVWYKKWIGAGHNELKWRQNHEYGCLGVYGEADVENQHRHDGNVWEFKRLDSNEMDHPTQKPVKLMKYIIEGVTEEGDVVFDPFAGSGATLVAAKQANRKYIGVEYDEKHYKTIQDRLSQGALSSFM